MHRILLRYFGLAHVSILQEISPGLALERLWVQPRIGGNNFGMIKSMLQFYLLNSDFANVDVDEVLSSGCWCHINNESYNQHKG